LKSVDTPVEINPQDHKAEPHQVNTPRLKAGA
jgi:hypothetical protein